MIGSVDRRPTQKLGLDAKHYHGAVVVPASFAERFGCNVWIMPAPWGNLSSFRSIVQDGHQNQRLGKGLPVGTLASEFFIALRPHCREAPSASGVD